MSPNVATRSNLRRQSVYISFLYIYNYIKNIFGTIYFRCHGNGVLKTFEEERFAFGRRIFLPTQ